MTRYVLARAEPPGSVLGTTSHEGLSVDDRHMLRRVPALLLTAMLGCAGTTPAPETPAPGDDGAETAPVAVSFSAEQVDRGRADFGILCGECHGPSEFRGTNFLFRWRRQSAWDFFRTVSTTMPENAPGSLSDEEYVDVISFILEMNGYSAGEGELPATEAALDRLLMDGGGR